MKKNITIIIIFMLIISSFGVSFGEVNMREIPLGIGGSLEMTNLNPDNPKLYVLLNGLRAILSNGHEDSVYLDIQLNDNFKHLGIDLNEYDVISSNQYNPNDFSFSSDNVIRTVTPYSKTQQDFDMYYYRPNNPETGHEAIIMQGSLRSYLGFSYKKDAAIYDLNEYFKTPNSEEAFIKYFQLGETGKDIIKSIKSKEIYGQKYSDSHLYSYAMVVELEKKSTELPVPAGDFIKTLNENEQLLSSHMADFSGDTLYIYSNLVDNYNKVFMNTTWSESYVLNEQGRPGGIIKFTGILANAEKYSSLSVVTGKQKDIKVEAHFFVPYSITDGYSFSTNEYTGRKGKIAYNIKFIAEGIELDENSITPISYAENTEIYRYIYNPKKIEKIK